jgi:hypothetical protein
VLQTGHRKGFPISIPFGSQQTMVAHYFKPSSFIFSRLGNLPYSSYDVQGCIRSIPALENVPTLDTQRPKASPTDAISVTAADNT